MLDLPSHRPTRAEINLDNLIHNLRVTSAALGEGIAIMPAVKADAYGHGAVECARALEEAGAQWFGVALPEEGITLREAGIAKPILCLGGFWEGQEGSLIAQRLTPVVFRLELLDRLDRAARASEVIVDYHLKVDTGMGRLGVPRGELKAFLDGASRLENVRLDGVLTHLASADSQDHSDFTERQMRSFEDAVEIIRARGHRPTWIHQANSAGAHAYPSSRGNLVRLGGVLYGLWRDVTNRSIPPLDWRAVMSLHTRVMLVKTVPAYTALGYGGTYVTSRESRIATLPIGYEDGLSRALSNRGEVIVRGRLAPIVGRVSMDLTLVDVTDIEDVGMDDEVVVIGIQGGIQLTAESIASQIGSISYEVTCGVSDRVPRIYSRNRSR
ncbi:MAG TPA: alanine racemase [Blastocatellia bacterium]|nr:alanine racemase [Blastocatellia bacterium]